MSLGVAAIFLSFALQISADTFLAKNLFQEDVKQLLLSELSGHTDGARLGRIENHLRPVYAALPKGEHGRLEVATVRYALHRYFLHEYGWMVEGLDAAGAAWDDTDGTTLLKARAPAYILSIFQEELHSKGMGLHELAAFAATITDLVHSEAFGQLEKIWTVMRLPTSGPVQSQQADSALRAFVTAYLLGSGMEIEGAADIPEMRALLEQQYPNLNETLMWVDDLESTHDMQSSPERNPFVQHPSTFDTTASLVLQFSHRFGSFQNLECHRLKRKLVELEHVGSGRVLLSQFYAQALSGDWEFMESVEYLRNQGALDETDSDHPAVVIPNYMNSRMNCLTASDFYAVCCLNECDEILGKVEQQIGMPSAEPKFIAEAVSHIQSDTVDAPRNLSAALVGRLHEIAGRNRHGLVPIHGRLFSQWMHHAYPRECPFPHVAGAVKPMYPEEFAAQMGVENLEVTQEVMEVHAARMRPETEDVLLPWTFEEELVGEDRKASRGAIRNLLNLLVAIASLVSFAVPLLYALRASLSSAQEGMVAKHLV